MGIGRGKRFVGDETCRVGEKPRRAGRNDPYGRISNLGVSPSTLSNPKGIPSIQMITSNIPHPPTQSTAEASQTKRKRETEHSRMIMTQTNQIDPGQLMQIDRRVRQPCPRNARSKMDMVARMEEILATHKPRHSKHLIPSSSKF